MGRIEIRSERLFLRSFSAEDAAALYSCITPPITHYMAWEPPASEREFSYVWGGWLQAMSDGREHYFIVRRGQDGTCLGLIGVHAMDTKEPEIGLWLREDAHGHGLGTEAVGAVLRWASAQLHCSHFEYPVAEANLASRRIALHFGGVIHERRSSPKYLSVVYHIPSITRPPSQR